MKIAYFSPLPPTHSGIADYSAELLPYLAAHADITLFAEDPVAVAEEIRGQFEVRPLTAYPAVQWYYDLPLYHMGNSHHHETIYQMCLRYPGLVVLHEPGLHHFIADRTIGQGNPVVYLRELAYAQIGTGPDYFSHLQADDVYRLPLSNRLVDISLGIIVHSRYAETMVRQLRPSIPTCVTPQPMLPQTGQPYRLAEIGAPDDAVIFASLGQITPHKQLELALRAFSQLRQSYPQAYFLIVGETVTTDADEITRLITELNLTPFVYQTGYVDTLNEFVNWLLLADVVLSLRHPTIGETSAVALRAMGAAKPLIVFDQGWYSEIPDAAALKVPPLDEATLVNAMRRLADDALARQQMGQAGQAYIRAHCTPEQAAAAYAGFIRYLLEKYGRTFL
ncbi:MAG TPA: glycosyltransferase family 4 protein [Chloroflexota bacterium]|nr:glycosyltransferase family 4 protein [Chloroflexota bacterium]